MDILFNYISALFWGILIGLIFSGFMMYLTHKICGISYLIAGLIGTFLFFFVTFQFTALIGANKAKNYIDDLVVSTQATGENLDWVTVKDKYPSLEPYLGETERSSESALDVATMITNSIDRYIWRRVGWIAGGIIVAFGVAIVGGVMEANRTSNHRRRTSGARRNNRVHRGRR